MYRPCGASLRSPQLTHNNYSYVWDGGDGRRGEVGGSVNWAGVSTFMEKRRR